MVRKETVIQVLVASPSDVMDERECLEEVVSELNRSWGRNQGIRLDLIRWETDMRPGFSDDPQQVINEQTPDDFGIFIGILWGRYGTQTKTAGSGTEEEFNRALKRHKANKDNIDIMIYFKTAGINPQEMNPKDIELVQKFKKRVSKEGGLYKEFNNVDEFKKLLRAHLSTLIQEYGRRFRGDQASNQIDNIVDAGEIENTEVVSSEDDDLGLFDALEMFEDSFQKATLNLAQISENFKDLTQKINNRSAEFIKFGQDKNRKLKTGIRISNNAAKDINYFLNDADKFIKDFATHFLNAHKGLVAAMLALEDFGEIDKSEIEQFINAMEDTVVSINEAMIPIDSMKGTVENLPRITGNFNRAKRRLVTFLYNQLEEYQSANNLVAKMIDLLKKYL